MTEPQRVKRASSILLILLLSISGCSSEGNVHPKPKELTPTPASDTAQSKGPCSIASPDPADVPDVLRAMGSNGEWCGVKSLWVRTPAASEISSAGKGAYRVKFASVTLNEQGEMSKHNGPPQVTAVRVDGSATARGSTGGYATASGDGGREIRWWPTTITFPSEGHWEVKEVLATTTVRFTLHVSKN